MAAQLAAGGYLRGGIALHLAIIGGTGVDQATLFGPTSTEEVRTPYGAVSVRAGAIGE